MGAVDTGATETARAWETLARLARETERRTIIGGLLMLLGLVLLPVLQFRFVYDDWWTFVSNGFLRTPGDLWLLLSPEAVARNIPDAFRPTLVVFDVLAYQLLGATPMLQHALSIALHLLVCWLLERWLATLGAPLLLRAASITLFGLLAIHAEVIAVVSFREDLLAAALGLAALQMTSKTCSGGRRVRARLLLASAVMAAACLAKMSAAPLPLVWLLAELLSPWRASNRRPGGRALAWGCFALALGVAVAVLHTVWLHGGISPYGGPGDDPTVNPRLFVNRVGLSAVLAQSTQIHVGYLQQIVAPFGLSPEYTDRGASWGDPATILASAALLLLFLWGLSCARRRRRPLTALCILAAFALALPTSNIVGMPNMRADRLVYLTSAPICVGLSSLALSAGCWLARRQAKDAGETSVRVLAWRLGPLVLLCVLQGAVLQAQAQVYRSSTHLWTAALKRAPDASRAHALYAETLLAIAAQSPRGELSHEIILRRIETHCRVARRLDARYELPEICFARLAVHRKAWEEAHEHFSRALALSPDRNARILAALAQLSLDRPGRTTAQRRQEAADVLTRGLRAYPYAPELRAVAGRVAHLTGDPWAAAAHYTQARALAPERVETALWGLELALDLGDAHAARKIWIRDRKVLMRAPELQRASLLLRTREVERLFPSRPRASILTDGVFPDEP